MYEDLRSSLVKDVESIHEELKRCRRDFHKYAEPGWLEIRTTSLIARRLTNLGYKVLVGENVCKDEARLGLPSQEKMDFYYQEALKTGGDKEFIESAKNGFTGAIGILECGEGPVTALRFDIDALGVQEDDSLMHIPTKEGFASIHPGVMHACGHDGHASIGLGVADILMRHKKDLRGSIKLIFQPAEEGVRGARSIVENGHLDGVQTVLACHLTGRKNQDDMGYDFWPGSGGALATTKIDVVYHGRSAHAGAAPEHGKNALLAAATAALNLAAISRHSDGRTRINVGTLHAGTGRNVIPDIAKMQIEVRGETDKINDFLEKSAYRIMVSCKMNLNS